MPRDVIPTTRKLPETEAEFLAASEEDCLRALVRELRQPTIRHHWDFRFQGGLVGVIEWGWWRAWPGIIRGCGSVGCAIGLCDAKFGSAARERLRTIATNRGIWPIFGYGSMMAAYPFKSLADVTRHDVAGAIEAHLAETARCA